MTVLAVDRYLDNLDSLLYAIEQRPLTTDQMDRFARLLQRGTRVALAPPAPRWFKGDTLHDVGCEGPAACRCRVVLRPIPVYR